MNDTTTAWWRNRSNLPFIVFLAIAIFWLVSVAWKVLHAAQRTRTLATTGAYAYRREVPAFFPGRSSLNGGSSGPEMQVIKD